MSESMAGEHLEDELSALLDGELGADERAAVEAHLSGCDECRAELDATRAVRDRLRGAGPVEPPFGFYERMVSRKHRARGLMAVAAVVAAAAVWIVVVGFVVAPEPRTTTPHVDALRSVVAGTPVGVSLHRPEKSGLRFPDSVAGRPRTTTFKAAIEGEGTGDAALFGTDPATQLLVYVAPGGVEWSGLQGGLRRPVDGLPGNPWQSIQPGTMPAIVVQQGETTVVITGNVDDGTLQEAAREIGDPKPQSTADHLRDAAGSLVDAFGLDR